MTASNTRDCFREFVGQRLVGLLFDALPSHRRDIASGTQALIFEDGRALVLASNGSYWIDSAGDVQRAIAKKEKELRAVEADISGVLSAARAASAALPGGSSNG